MADDFVMSLGGHWVQAHGESFILPVGSLPAVTPTKTSDKRRRDAACLDATVAAASTKRMGTRGGQVTRQSSHLPNKAPDRPIGLSLSRCGDWPLSSFNDETPQLVQCGTLARRKSARRRFANYLDLVGDKRERPGHSLSSACASPCLKF